MGCGLKLKAEIDSSGLGPKALARRPRAEARG